MIFDVPNYHGVIFEGLRSEIVKSGGKTKDIQTTIDAGSVGLISQFSGEINSDQIDPSGYFVKERSGQRKKYVMPFFKTEEQSPNEDAVVNAGHYGIHNFTFGTLDTYFQLDQSKPEWFGDKILTLISPQGLVKTWVFNWVKQVSSDDVVTLHNLQRRGPIYSQQRLPLPGESKFHEVAYNLNEILNPTTYTSHKKRHKVLYYPGRWFQSNGFQLITIDGCPISAVKLLHDQWVEHKLAQPSTYKLMFPRARYFNCCLKSRKNKRYLPFVALNKDNDVVAVRVLYKEDNAVFDLANFAATWRLPSNFSEAFAMMTMLEMNQMGISYLNCGASLNKSLSAFKSHWQHYEILSWAYSKQS